MSGCRTGMERGPADPPADRVDNSQAGFEFALDMLVDGFEARRIVCLRPGQSRQTNGSPFFAVSWSLTGSPLLRSMEPAVHWSTLAPSLTCLSLTTAR